MHLSVVTGKWSNVNTVNSINKPPMCIPTASPSAAPTQIGNTNAPSVSPSVIPSASPSVNETCLKIALQKHCGSTDWSGAIFTFAGPNNYYMSQGVTVSSPVLSHIIECPKAEGLYVLTVHMNSSGAQIPNSVYNSVSLI